MTRRPRRARSTTRRKISVDLPAPGRPIIWLTSSRSILSVGASPAPCGESTEKTACPCSDLKRVRKLRGTRVGSRASSSSSSLAIALEFRDRDADRRALAHVRSGHGRARQRWNLASIADDVGADVPVDPETELPRVVGG